MSLSANCVRAMETCAKAGPVFMYGGPEADILETLGYLSTVRVFRSHRFRAMTITERGKAWITSRNSRQ